MFSHRLVNHVFANHYSLCVFANHYFLFARFCNCEAFVDVTIRFSRKSLSYFIIFLLIYVILQNFNSQIAFCLSRLNFQSLKNRNCVFFVSHFYVWSKTLFFFFFIDYFFPADAFQINFAALTQTRIFFAFLPSGGLR